jgi:cytochrome c
VVALAIVAATVPVLAQMPTFGLGRTPTAEEVRAWDIAIGPDGQELPPGSGTAVAGKVVYEKKCLDCHGAGGKDGKQDVLVGGQGSLGTARPLKTIGSYWPYATTIFDYVRRAMPYPAPHSLTDNETYAITAYVLHLNGIIGPDDVMDAASLPKVRMPNRDGFVNRNGRGR